MVWAHTHEDALPAWLVLASPIMFIGVLGYKVEEEPPRSESLQDS